MSAPIYLNDRGHVVGLVVEVHTDTKYTKRLISTMCNRSSTI